MEKGGPEPGPVILPVFVCSAMSRVIGCRSFSSTEQAGPFPMLVWAVVCGSWGHSWNAGSSTQGSERVVGGSPTPLTLPWLSHHEPHQALGQKHK